MIKISDLKENDIGKWCTYTPKFGDVESGRIKSWNDQFIIVVYKCDNNWDNFQNYTGQATKPEDLKWGNMKLEPHCDYGDLMSLDDFIACCECGGFIDYDGYGHYATSTMQSDIKVYPSDILKRKINENFTHVMWYNR